jgi:hypothetical protein
MDKEKAFELANKFATYYPSSFSVGYWPFSEESLLKLVQAIEEELKCHTVDGPQ